MPGGNPQWYWNASPNPFVPGQPAVWTAYSPEDNKLIEEHYQNKSHRVDLKNHFIQFHERMQVHKHDFNKQRPIKRDPYP